MSRIRRIGYAAAAVVALALAIPTSSSAISVSSTATGSSGGTFNVTGAMTFYHLSSPSSADFAVGCWETDNETINRYGRGLAWGGDSAAFQPRFLEPSPVLSGGCYTQDSGVPGGYGDVDIRMQGAFMLTLTGLAPGANPLATRRAYEGKLWLHSYSKITFHLTDYANCTVTLAGPQSVDVHLGSSTGHGLITVDDVKDEIDVSLLSASFASTKTAGCPSSIRNTVTIMQPYYPRGWKLNGVTVTP